MRIIAGSARGRRLQTLPGQNTRPTLERVKEGMFSAVQNWLPGAAVLDLFAGSGQLGLEALSRGAARCVFVENTARAAGVAEANIRALGFGDKARLVRSDAEAFLARREETFDLVLIDPPFEGGYYPRIIEAAAAVCAPGALVLCEAARDTVLPETIVGLILEKRYRYGTVAVSRYRMQREEADE
jgi:16S rRNA (guanine(966)-N(2))-methyltransferase RsmD